MDLQEFIIVFSTVISVMVKTTAYNLWIPHRFYTGQGRNTLEGLSPAYQKDGVSLCISYVL